MRSLAPQLHALTSLSRSPPPSCSFAGYINEILLGLGATTADREAYFWATGAQAYRVAAPS